ncbi:MAG: hypothetical protein HY905_19480 [Deltaproteobacteria bacterium]|nr:hypothetical protein [Deltaproteobacteria bacterium]
MRVALSLACLLSAAACGSTSTDDNGQPDSAADSLAESDASAEADADAGPDADVAPDGPDAADVEPEADGTPDHALEEALDAADADADTPADTDAVPEADSTPEADATPETDAPDADDGAADLPVDAPADTPDGGGSLTVTMTSLEAWTIIFMGSGNHAVFTLVLTNTGSGDVTGFHAVTGKVTGAGGADLFTFTGPSALHVGSTSGPLFDGRVPAGGSATVAGQGSATDPSLSTHCGEDVMLSLDVAWDGGATSVVGGPAGLMCVSK